MCVVRLFEDEQARLRVRRLLEERPELRHLLLGSPALPVPRASAEAAAPATAPR